MSSVLAKDRVAILIPSYGAAESLDLCLKSLAKYCPPETSIFVLDDGTPDDSIAKCCDANNMPNLTYVRSEVNQGFVATCNWGWREICPKGYDILLLNSDTEVTASFIDEMLRVLYCSDRHGAVSPRSNNATLLTFPPGPPLPQSVSYAIWSDARQDLPVYTVMPTLVGFCLLMKRSIVDEFGLFDQVYGAGYSEENDFICRINRRGFSAVAANHAFVFHHENSTFGSRGIALEEKNRPILLQRYPEYQHTVDDYFIRAMDPVEAFSILAARQRRSILYDLTHLPALHCGTSEFGLCLLREMYRQAESEFEFFLTVGETGPFFASELNGYDFFVERPGTTKRFDLVFKPGQIFTWQEFRRMARLAPRLAFVLQDIIAVRCNYIGRYDSPAVFQKTAELADLVFTISKATKDDFQSYFQRDLKGPVIHHGTDCEPCSGGGKEGKYVLVMGNEYTHKGVSDVLPYLSALGPTMVVGGAQPEAGLPDGVEWLSSGRITRLHMRQIMRDAWLLLYPSYYEGYGLPVVDALASGKKVIAWNTEVGRELSDCLLHPDLHLVNSMSELPGVIGRLRTELRAERTAGCVPPRRWSEVATEYLAYLRELIYAKPDVPKMRAREELIRILDSYSRQ